MTDGWRERLRTVIGALHESADSGERVVVGNAHVSTRERQARAASLVEVIGGARKAGVSQEAIDDELSGIGLPRWGWATIRGERERMRFLGYEETTAEEWRRHVEALVGDCTRIERDERPSPFDDPSGQS